MTHRSLKTPAVVGVVALVAIVLLFIVPVLGTMGGTTAPATAAMQADQGADPTPTPTPTLEGCDAAFVQREIKHEGNKVDSDFEKDYVAATAADAANLSESARDLLLEKAGYNAQFLAIRANELGLYEDPNDWERLVKDGCLSDEGEKLHAQYEGVLKAKGTTIVEADAPANGFNSGVHDGVLGVANAAGIRGDLRAIKITLKDGTSVYILIRCANGVHPSNPGLPEVPTDNPPPPKECPPELPFGEYPNCKDAPTQDPGPRGNAPVGNGRNDDTGPGTYIPEENMERPKDKPRDNPPPPKPEPPSDDNSDDKPKPKPTEDPQPPPPPENEPDQPKPPKPDNPEDGCIVIPGLEDCK